jgi:hypothetical protein
MTFIRQHLPDLIKSDSKIDSGEQQTSGTIQPRMLASSDEGREFEEEGGLSVKPSPPVS